MAAQSEVWHRRIRRGGWGRGAHGRCGERCSNHRLDVGVDSTQRLMGCRCRLRHAAGVGCLHARGWEREWGWERVWRRHPLRHPRFACRVIAIGGSNFSVHCSIAVVQKWTALVQNRALRRVRTRRVDSRNFRAKISFRCWSLSEKNRVQDRYTCFGYRAASIPILSSSAPLGRAERLL